MLTSSRLFLGVLASWRENLLQLSLTAIQRRGITELGGASLLGSHQQRRENARLGASEPRHSPREFEVLPTGQFCVKKNLIANMLLALSNWRL